MNLVCVICSELLAPSDDVFYTPCGHIFHFACLIQWLERSKTCPQCRDRTTEQTIRRIYFNFSNSDSIAEDAASLQNRIDGLTFQLKLRDENLNKLTEANGKLETQTAGLRREVRNVESEMKGKNSAILALKEQIKFYKQQCSDANTYRKENEHLKKNLQHLKNVQSLIDISTGGEVDDKIMLTSDPSKLTTYIAVLKRELKHMSNKSREVREKYKKLQQEYTRASTENKVLTEERTKRKEMEERLMICESEKISLQTKLLDIQENPITYTCVSSKTAIEKLKEKLESIKAHKEHENLEKNDSCIIINPDSTEDTPQSIKSQGFFSMRDNGIKRQKSSNSLKETSILAKKSKFYQPNQKTASGSGMSFDGFGGHARYDKFPDPIPSSHVKKSREDLRTKKPKLDTGDNQKLNDILHMYDV
ncbi:E3 ubiquitin-protein ligase TRAIP-like [Temnothorax nylanderi]|uniref:E3 ubiquitin-protein ligase TRAIP-like n=1 Tax=Temnothorax nylanderi TaxID=102681 RepID=UPI003A8642B3